MFRADFWAYASIMAINLGVANINSGVASSGTYCIVDEAVL